jgi:hypothetical protein
VRARVCVRLRSLADGGGVVWVGGVGGGCGGRSKTHIVLEISVNIRTTWYILGAITDIPVNLKNHL